MDPDVALRELVDALQENRLDEVPPLLIDLQAWIRKGGWVPTLNGYQWTELLEVLIKLSLDGRSDRDPRGV